MPRIQPCTVKAVSDCRVSKDALPMFEPDEVKVSRPVLRGLGAGNSPRLPGLRQDKSLLILLGFEPTCCITGSFLFRRALPAMVLCEARLTMKPLVFRPGERIVR